MEPDDDGSFASVGLLGDENVCSDFVVVDFLVGGLDEVQACEFGGGCGGHCFGEGELG